MATMMIFSGYFGTSFLMDEKLNNQLTLTKLGLQGASVHYASASHKP